MILTKLLSTTKTQNKSDSNYPSSLGRGSYYISPKVAGVYVDHDTALTYAAFWLCVKIISETIAGLPLNVFNRVNSKDKEHAYSSPYQTLLNYPSPEMTAFKWRQTTLAHKLVWGNAYSEILRDRSNIPRELLLITPDRVNKDRSRTTKKIYYEISNSGAANTYLEEKDVLHNYGMGFDGLTGYSVVEMARRTLGVGMAMETFSSSFYENGTQLSGIIKAPMSVTLGAPGREELKKQFKSLHSGVNKFHDIEVLDRGMEYQQLGMPLKDAQYIEDQKFKVLDVARWFNMPPHKLKDLDRATFSNIEEQNIDFVVDTLLPHIIDFESTTNTKLIGPNNTRQYVKHNLNAQLRGNLKDRVEAYTKLFRLGWSSNELRALEDENSIGPDGDKRFVEMNLTTLEKAGEDEPQPEPMPIDQQPQEQSETEIENFTALVNDLFTRTYQRIDSIHARNKNETTEKRANRFNDIYADLNKTLSLMADSFTNQRNTNVDSFVGAAISSTVNHYETKEQPTLTLVNYLTERFVDLCTTIKIQKA